MLVNEFREIIRYYEIADCCHCIVTINATVFMGGQEICSSELYYIEIDSKLICITNFFISKVGKCTFIQV